MRVLCGSSGEPNPVKSEGLPTSVLMPVNLSERCLRQVAFIFGQCGLRLFLVTAVTAVTGSYCWLLQLLRLLGPKFCVGLSGP